mmetsp:Transcript_26458/g.61688  ORF Transcript_26458/g.61688 Transcript_26458/m.61688 type:complete len:266 (+) Transcript_26458:658-1455(+)
MLGWCYECELTFIAIGVEVLAQQRHPTHEVITPLPISVVDSEANRFTVVELLDGATEIPDRLQTTPDDMSSEAGLRVPRDIHHAVGIRSRSILRPTQAVRTFHCNSKVIRQHLLTTFHLLHVCPQKIKHLVFEEALLQSKKIINIHSEASEDGMDLRIAHEDLKLFLADSLVTILVIALEQLQHAVAQVLHRCLLLLCFCDGANDPNQDANQHVQNCEAGQENENQKAKDQEAGVPSHDLHIPSWIVEEGAMQKQQEHCLRNGWH